MARPPVPYGFVFQPVAGDFFKLTEPSCRDLLNWSLEPRVVRIAVAAPRPGVYVPLQKIRAVRVVSTEPGTEKLIRVPQPNTWRIDGGTHAVIKLEVDPRELKLLRDPPLQFRLEAELEVEAADYYRALKPGAAGPAGKLIVTRNSGVMQVEFPHPIVHLPRTRFGEGDIVVDTTRVEGSAVEACLLRFKPASAFFADRVDERLAPALAIDVACPASIDKLTASGFHIKSERLVIGPSPLRAGHLTLARDPARTPAAMNAGRDRHPILYRPAPSVNVTFRLVGPERGAEPGPPVTVPIPAERVRVQFPHIPGDFAGHVIWEIDLTSAPDRLRREPGAFATGSHTATLDRAQPRGFELALTAHPLTRGGPVDIGLAAADVDTVIVVPTRSLQIDSAGTPIAARLHAATADGTPGAALDEALQVDCQALRLGVQLDGPPRADGFTLRPARPVVGAIPAGPLARVTLSRSGGRRASLNQPLELEVTCRPLDHLAVDVELQLTGEPKPSRFRLQVPGESVIFYVPKLPKDTSGTIRWTVTGAAAPFAIAPGRSAPLGPVTVPGVPDALGVLADLVDAPLSKAAPVPLEASSDLAIRAPAAPQRLLVPTDAADGAELDVGLWRWDAAHDQPGDRVDEPLTARATTDLLWSACPIEVPDRPFTGPLRVRAHRPVIGPLQPDQSVGRIELARPDGKPARFQPLTIEVAYGTIPQVDVELTVQLAGDPPPPPETHRIKVPAEQVTCWFPKLPLSTGTVTWRILDPPPLLRRPQSRFVTAPQQAPLTRVQIERADRCGLELRLHPEPLTRGSPIAVGQGSTSWIIEVPDHEDKPPAPFPIPTNHPDGVELTATLREWSPETGPGTPLDEALEATIVPDPAHASVAPNFGDPAKPTPGRIRLRAPRVLIGKPSDEPVAELRLQRAPGRPPARDQPRTIPLLYERERTATLQVTLRLEGDPPDRLTTQQIDVDGEQAILYLPDLQPTDRGTLDWKVTAPSRATDFAPGSAALTDVDVPGLGLRRGVTISLVPHPLTQALPAPLKVERPPADLTLQIDKVGFKRATIPLPSARYPDLALALTRNQPVPIAVEATVTYRSPNLYAQIPHNGDVPVSHLRLTLTRAADGRAVPFEPAPGTPGARRITASLELADTLIASLTSLEQDAVALAAELNKSKDRAGPARSAADAMQRYVSGLVEQYANGTEEQLLATEEDRQSRLALLRFYWRHLTARIPIFDQMRELRKSAAFALANAVFCLVLDLIPFFGDVIKQVKDRLKNAAKALAEALGAVGDSNLAHAFARVAQLRADLAAKLSTARSSLEALGERLASVRTQAERAAERAVDLADELAKLGRETADALAHKAGLERAAASAAAKVEAAAAELAAKRRALGPLEERLRTLRGKEAQALEKEIEALGMNEAKDNLKHARKLNSELQEQLGAASQRVDSAKSAQAAASEMTREAERAAGKLDAEASSLGQQHANARSEVDLHEKASRKLDSSEQSLHDAKRFLESVNDSASGSERFGFLELAEYVASWLKQRLSLVFWLIGTFGNAFGKQFLKLLRMISHVTDGALAACTPVILACCSQATKELGLWLLKQGLSLGIGDLTATGGDLTSTVSRRVVGADTRTERRLQKQIRGALPQAPAPEIEGAEGAVDAAHCKNFIVALEVGLAGASQMAAESHLESDRAGERLTRADVRERFVKVNDYDACLLGWYRKQALAADNLNGPLSSFYTFVRQDGNGTLAETMNNWAWIEWLVAWALRILGVVIGAGGLATFGLALPAAVAGGMSVYFIADTLDVIKDLFVDFFVGIYDLLMKTKVTIFESFYPAALEVGLFMKDCPLPDLKALERAIDVRTTQDELRPVEIRVAAVQQATERHVGQLVSDDGGQAA